MKSILKKLALTSVFACGMSLSPAHAQNAGGIGSGEIITLTNQNEADVVNAANTVPVLAAIGSPAFFATHRTELATIAAARKNKLVVVYANPSTISDANEIVAQLTNGDINYPMVLYLGNETHKLKGTIAPGAITTLVNAELRR